MIDDDEIMTTRQAAEFLGSTINSLTSMRSGGGGPIYFRDTDGFHVRYRKRDLVAYLASRTAPDHARAKAAAIARGEKKAPPAEAGEA